MSTKEIIKDQAEFLSESTDSEDYVGVLEPDKSLIIIELAYIDYSLANIAHIIESNDAKILSLYVNTLNDGTDLRISIKLNISDPSPVVMSLERFNYNVTNYYMQDEEITLRHKERLDELMYYLEM
ncbi:MAG: hypothetical protein ACOYEA_05540 [Fermentimonas sp.]|jgi:hypothetical protein